MDDLLPEGSYLSDPVPGSRAAAGQRAVPPRAGAPQARPPGQRVPAAQRAAQANRDIAIQVENLFVHYEVFADRNDTLMATIQRGFRQRQTQHIEALENINFSLYRGDALGLIGHNGSGKSTLLQTIAGFLRPSSGSVLVRHQPQILGVQAALNPRISGRRNIEMGCLALGFNREQVWAMTPEIIEFTELDQFIDLPVNTYSTGMRARLGFAISTVSRPEILLIDEALAVGDKGFRDRSLARLRELRDGAGTVVLASHSMNEVLRSCNKVLWLHEGEVRQFGHPKRVVADYKKTQERARRRVTAKQKAQKGRGQNRQ